MSIETRPVVAVVSLREFFHDSVQGALRNQKVRVADQTEQYVVNLLTEFTNSDKLFHSAEGGKRLRPLALMLSEATEAPTPAKRDVLLQRMADVSLFVAGFFVRGFERMLTDVDYHISMGSNAYNCLADRAQASPRTRVLASIYLELAQNFQRMVDVLNEVSEMSYTHTQQDVLRHYEIWVKTGSPRSFGILKRLGVAPVRGSNNSAH